MAKPQERKPKPVEPPIRRADEEPEGTPPQNPDPDTEPDPGENEDNG